MSNTINGNVPIEGNLRGNISVVYGKDGNDGRDGRDGYSAYELAVENGFVGTEEDWLKSLQGNPGVYLGSGEMPEDCNVQIDPTGEPIEVYTKAEVDALIDSAIGQALEGDY